MKSAFTVFIAAVLSAQLCGCFMTGQTIRDQDVTEDQRDFLRSQSSGRTGCAAHEIGITNVSGKTGAYVNWTATCKGQAYQCSNSPESTAACTASTAARRNRY